ncbi:hypothetical protein [Pseudomonas savastanoi]|uniref:hypothetical protein n=1 Tax=Pseudomonas savastanoi TaxID=29438 RepID=UPI00073A1641|nr:hypothetical protein [Pseudomonas savastanoi]KAA3533375.1 hypothetical protein DXU85_27185 [Pseudomonas savastanoi]KUG41495.1 hypothetical protein ALP79_200203 [Pseudomonas savastanoi pv. fraxini]KWS62799.1 hypothetical protein AL053_01070 [Pseudomonas savastanoi pv. fraxini]RML72596.1 hypothetical protein ALQ90_200089 [Pseudomonas savastanoi pv. savastanoi]RMN63203.1 hypothetical protein ALQ55_200140 [Pseudomonas savastanoi pv. savastanoi]
MVQIAAFIGGAAGLLVLLYNIAVIANHFDDFSMPTKLFIAAVVFAILLFVLMVGYYAVRHLLTCAWRRLRRR